MAKLPFKPSSLEDINRAAEKSQQALEKSSNVQTSKMNKEITEATKKVLDYFKDSPAILITSSQQLHNYIDKIIEYGYAGIDTETTGLDRINDTIVGASLYVPGMPECYIPCKHIIPIFNELYKDQLSYEQVHVEFQRLVDNKVKLIFANADFDLSMIYKDIKVDLNSVCYYDVILAWRCLKENELHNDLKSLYNKYVLKGKGDPMKFRDFFKPEYFPYCKPQVAKLYAANDAKITFELFKFQLPFVTKDNPKCQKSHLEAITDLVWNVELPLIEVCQNMHRLGIYLDKDVATQLQKRYNEQYNQEVKVLQTMVQEEIYKEAGAATKRPFRTGADFNPSSPIHVKYLCYDMLNLPEGRDGKSTNKETLAIFNLPITNQILKVRSISTLISTFVKKLPGATTSDSRIHATFRQIGADTGRFSSAEPNLQNIPSHAADIRHMFRATASSSDMIDCTEDESSNDIVVSLSKYDSVYLENNEQKSVKNLIPGDSIKLICDDKEIFKTLKSIQDSSRDLSVCDLIFEG